MAVSAFFTSDVVLVMVCIVDGACTTSNSRLSARAPWPLILFVELTLYERGVIITTACAVDAAGYRRRGWRLLDLLGRLKEQYGVCAPLGGWAQVGDASDALISASWWLVEPRHVGLLSQTR